MKDQILNTASDMFLSLGFKSVTMDDIAQEMGISKKTIYLHYSTKTKLVEASTYHVLEGITHGIEEIRTQNLNPIAELFEIKKLAINSLKNEQSSPRYQLEKYYPEIFYAVQDHHNTLMAGCIDENIVKGKETGIYRKSISNSFIRKMYFIGLTGIKNPENFAIEKFALSTLLEQFLEYHLRAIVTPKGIELLKDYVQIED